MNINYTALRPMDCVCTASSSGVGRAIRFLTAGLVGKNGLWEAGAMRLANHVGLIVEMGGKLWVAEMLGDGLNINSLRRYTEGKGEKIVGIRRLPRFDIAEIRAEANQYVIDLAEKTKKYDFAGILQFLRIGRQKPKYAYCSELAEIAANKFFTTWDAWQLTLPAGRDQIAPCQIQYGKGAVVEGWAG